ncbi:hypothetical protein C8R43DRAFT_1089692 [Mycena crocata]|nr:hypothetical protein C8R43DRAFT_1089692 [Mycena crocata]
MVYSLPISKATDSTAIQTQQDKDRERSRSRSRSPTDNAIDDLESRPHRPLPIITPAQRAMNSTPFEFPNPEDMTGLPTLASENPHIQKTKSGPTPAKIPDPDKLTVPFTLAQFDRIVLPFGTMTRNMDPAQLDPIREKPGEYISILPHGAGKAFYKENPNANRHVKKFLESLDLDTSGIDIALPKAAHNSNKARAFDAPWPMILSGASQELRDFLLWQQSFSVHDELCFHALPFDLAVESWLVLTISGDAVRDDEKQKAKVLGQIKKELWADLQFVNFTNKVLAAKGVQGSPGQRVVEATSTFNLVYVDTDNQHGVHAPCYQLLAKPISSDPDTHRTWVALIRDKRRGYVVGMHALIIDKRFIDCIWCKTKIHPAHGCTFHRTPGWLSLTPDGADRYAARVRKETEKDGGHQGGGKGNRGVKRTNDDRGGWKTVSHGKGGKGKGRGGFRGGTP